LLRSSITAMNRRVGALLIREPTHLLLLLLLSLSQRDLVARIPLLILEQQLTRKFLVQLGLFGLFCRVCGGWLVYDGGGGE